MLVGIVDKQLLQAVRVELLEPVDVQHADEAPHVASFDVITAAGRPAQSRQGKVRQDKARKGKTRHGQKTRQTSENTG